jgi:hypothetical protein
MNKFGFALVGAASLALAGCSGSNDDALNNVENTDASANLDALANAAAVDAEAEALGNQAAQLNQESNATDELNASGTSEAEENVSGM